MIDMTLWVVLCVALFIGFAFGVWFSSSLSKKQQNQLSGITESDAICGLSALFKEHQSDDSLDACIETLEKYSEDVEAHIALGRLFRRRGEIERAIGVYQKLLARPGLSDVQSKLVRLELAHNYMKAGLLDRSEHLLIDLVISDWNARYEAIRLLLKVYEQEGEWQQAVDLLVHTGTLREPEFKTELAHYYCELAECTFVGGNYPQARKLLEKALHVDQACVRAILVLGQVQFALAHYRNAAKILQKIFVISPEFISESIPLLLSCYEKGVSTRGLSVYLGQCMQDHPSVAVMLAAAKLINQQQGGKEASRFIAAQIVKQPSLKGLNALINIHIPAVEGRAKENLLLLQDLVIRLLDSKPLYCCKQCGFEAKTLYWHCPKCHFWGTVVPLFG